MATAFQLTLPPRDSRTPVYRWLYASVRAGILDGLIRLGTRLPASRDLARHYRISRGTVVNAFEQLKSEGYLEGRMGAGTFVCTILPDTGKGDVSPMNDQETFAAAQTEQEKQTLFDELAGLVPEKRQAEYYRVIAHTRTLSPNDEMLRILEAMGVLALLTRETPGEIAAERNLLRKILEASASQANAVEKRMEAYISRLESRLTQLPKELETGLDPPRIAKLLSESLRQCFRQSGLPETSVALGQSCSEMHSAQKQLVNVLREIAHLDVGVVARIRTANDSLLRSMTTRAQQMDDFLVRLEKQVWGIWLPVIASAALALGFVLGTWFTSVPKVGSAPPDTSTLQQLPMQTSPQPQVIPQRSGKRH